MNFGDNGEVLYDMVKDPHQYTNVIDDPKYAATVRTARLTLQKRLDKAK
jgi:hypothetical protein